MVCGGEDSYRWYYQQGRVTCEVVTAAQIDRRARTNNIELTSPSGRRVRLPGQGGMADVADLHQNFFLYLTRHSPLTLVENVQRLSAARSLTDPAARRPAGLRPGVIQLITNLGVFRYAPSARRAGPAEPAPRGQPGRPARVDRLRARGRRRPHGHRGTPGRDAPGAARADRPARYPPARVRPARERAELLAACIAAEQDLIDRARHLSLAARPRAAA